jgi:hypothetical protein
MNREDVITDWRDFVNETIPYTFSNIDTTNIIIETDDDNDDDDDMIMKITGNEYFSFTFPNDCVVTCNGECYHYCNNACNNIWDENDDMSWIYEQNVGTI